MLETLEKQTNYYPFIESDPKANAVDLRAQFNENSYIFFRSLVAPEKILQVRRAVLELCMEAGWLDPNSDVMDAIVRPGVKPTSEGKPGYAEVYRKVLRLPLFHDFPDDPALLTIAGTLLEVEPAEVLVHLRRIGRITFPNNKGATTPPHQDFFYIRGSVDTYSCWIPLGECPVELGGLAIMPGSHRGGYLEHTAKFPGAVGGTGIPVDESTATWHTTDFGLGDALFFHSHSIHKALPNLLPDRLRISTDNRYQRPQDKIEPDALLPHAVASEEYDAPKTRTRTRKTTGASRKN